MSDELIKITINGKPFGEWTKLVAGEPISEGEPVAIDRDGKVRPSRSVELERSLEPFIGEWVKGINARKEGESIEEVTFLFGNDSSLTIGAVALFGNNTELTFKVLS